MSSTISTNISSEIIDHIKEKHEDNELFNLISNITNIDISNISNTYTNNIISNIIFGDSNNTDVISVYTHNFVKDDTPPFNYIIKEYANGIVEMYILIETTNTYYINHVPGAGQTKVFTESIDRKNI